MRIPKSKAVYVSAAAVAVMAGAAATAMVDYKTVTIQQNGHNQVIHGFSSGTLASFLKAHHVSVSQHDRITPSLESPVRNDMEVTIEAPKTVTIVDGQVPRTVLTFAKTVGDLLKSQGIALNSGDVLETQPNSPLRDGSLIQIKRLTQKVQVKTSEIPFQTIRRTTNSLYVGQQKILTHGVKGLLEVKTTDVFMDAHKIRQFVSQTVVHSPVNQVIEVGTKQHRYTLSARGGGTMIVLKKLTVVATAYVGGGRTSTGWRAWPGVIAVDPSVIPIGTKLYIPGVGVVRAEDTGGSIVGNRIDICVSTQGQADAWGRRVITIYEIE